MSRILSGDSSEPIEENLFGATGHSDLSQESKSKMDLNLNLTSSLITICQKSMNQASMQASLV